MVLVALHGVTSLDAPVEVTDPGNAVALVHLSRKSGWMGGRWKSVTCVEHRKPSIVATDTMIADRPIEFAEAGRYVDAVELDSEGQAVVRTGSTGAVDPHFAM